MKILGQNGNKITQASDVWVNDNQLQAQSYSGIDSVIGTFSSPEAALAELNAIVAWVQQGAKGIYPVRSREAVDGSQETS